MKLLIVEDSHLLRGRLAAFFADFPTLEVTAAATTVLGVACFREWVPDIAILDIQLPDGSGIDLLKIIKRERPATQVLMFSNHVTCQRQCQTEGADWFFDKASDFEALAATVRALAQGTSTGAAGEPST